MKRTFLHTNRTAWNFYKKLFLVILLYFSYTQTDAQQKEWVSIHYHYANKLEQEIILESFEDQDGFIWMINNSGITRFDGQDFNFFSCSGDRYTRYLTYFRYPGNDSLYVLSYPGKGIFRCKNGQILEASDLSADYNNMVRFTNHFAYSPKTVAENKGAALESRTRWVKKSSVEGLLLEEFLTSGKDIYSVDISAGAIHWFSENGEAKKTVAAAQMMNNFLLHDTLTILTRNGQLIQLYNGEKVNSIDLKGAIGKKIRNAANRDFEKHFIADRDILYFTDSTGCYRVNIHGPAIQLAALNLPDRVTAVSSIICKRKTGQYFISSSKEGVYLVKPSPFTSICNKSSAFPSNVQVSMLETGKDSLLLGTGLLYSKGKFTAVLPPMYSFILYRDNRGNIYYSPKPYGLWYTDKKFRLRKKIYCEKNFPVGGFVMTPAGHIYVSSQSDIYRLQNDSLKLIKNIVSKHDNGQEIFSIQMKSENEMLVGTESALLLLDIRTGKMKTLFTQSIVRTLVIDSLQNTWIGTYGKGYYLLDKNNKLTAMPLDRDANLRFVHCFIHDQQGNVWMSTNNGLFKTKLADIYRYQRDPKEHIIQYTRFTKLDGIINNEFNGGGTQSAIAAANGILYFSNMGGVIQMNPANVIQADENNKIFIETALLDKHPIEVTDSIRLPNNYSAFDVSLLSNRFSGPGTVEYAIDTLNPIWQTVNNKTIQLGKLGSGEHILLLRKDINGQGTDYVYKKLTLFVAPKFYESRLFISLTGAALFFILFLVYFLTRKRQLSIQRKLEAIVEIKTEELNKTIIELSENYITLNKITGIVVHDLRSPISFIGQLVKKLISARDGLPTTETDQQLSVLSGGIEKMSLQINKMLPWLVNSLKSSAQDYRTNITFVLTEAADYYNNIISEKGNVLSVMIAPDLYGNIEPNTLSIVIRNILDNANKYTNRGKIELEATAAKGDRLLIRITDNGVGFDVEKKMAEVAHFATSSLNTMGLKIITDMIKKDGISYSLESTPGKGTSFKIWIAGA